MRASLEANESRNNPIMDTNGDVMMPRMHFGIARMNVLDNYNNDDEMTVLFLKMFYLMVIGYMFKIQ